MGEIYVTRNGELTHVFYRDLRFTYMRQFMKPDHGTGFTVIAMTLKATQSLRGE